MSKAHHRTAADDFHRFGKHSREIGNVLISNAVSDPKVSGIRASPSGDRHRSHIARLTERDGFIDRKRGMYVIYDRAHVRRKRAFGNDPTGQSENQLFFRALRILGLQRADPNEIGSDRGKRRHRVGFIILDADIGGLNAERSHKIFDALHDLGRAL